MPTPDPNSSSNATPQPAWRRIASQSPLPGNLGRLSGLFLSLGLLFCLGIFFWFFCRIEPGSGEIAVLIHKTGNDLPPGAIIATDPEQKGIQFAVLSEGRYFRNPYAWGWIIAKITDIPAGKLGVLTRVYGQEPPPGQIMVEGDCNQASPGDQKGVIATVLRPGKYRINPYACQLERFDAIAIRPGAVGVVTSLVGKDVLSGDLPPAARNTYLVGEDLKGVVARTLDPGVYYLNPYVYNVVEVTLQSQRFVLGGADAINFLSMYGFNVDIEGTIEFGIERNRAALLTHQVGDMDDVLKKLILPQARGFSRIEGSKYPAVNFIVGETRQKFQDNLEQHLREKAGQWGVAIKSVLIRNIVTPDAISSVIRDREVSVQNARKFEQQIEQARSLAELTRQEMLALQNQEKVAAETSRIQAVIRAEQDLAVKMTAANRELEVARLENQAAVAQAEAILAKAQAERDVIALNNKAQADVIASQTRAFKTGLNLARYAFYQKIGPRIVSLLGNDTPDSFGGLFQPYLSKEARP
jgi:regulator of protease activity HflC (stomatin/prohibitin superfamily)